MNRLKRFYKAMMYRNPGLIGVLSNTPTCINIVLVILVTPILWVGILIMATVELLSDLFSEVSEMVEDAYDKTA